MNFTQMQDRLRTELLRRIQRGTASVTLISQQSGYGKSHVSNFLRNRGQLSIKALNRLLAAQQLEIEDLVHTERRPLLTPGTEPSEAVPLVSHTAVLYEPIIQPGSIQMWLQLPPGSLRSLRPRAVASRKTWQRFVAIRVPREDAIPMNPALYPNTIAIIDRHYNSLASYRPHRANIYAVRYRGRITLRHVDYGATCLALRARDTLVPIELIEIRPGSSLGELIAGRVALTFNEM